MRFSLQKLFINNIEKYAIGFENSTMCKYRQCDKIYA
jgi:hypothetical protein